MEEQNIIKSIIYGNIIQTSYGMIRALCSAINSKDHIDKIVLYLKNNHNFLKYNKFIYAFRLEHTDSDLFITEGYVGRPKFLEGYNDDTGLEGVGEKLLSLLQKFNVRNVLVILAVRQRDPLRAMYSEHYVEMVKSAKDLLSSLYDKVVYSKNEQGNGIRLQVQGEQGEQLDFKEPIETTQFKIPLKTYYKAQKPVENPNYVGVQFLKKKEEGSLQSQYGPQIKYLNKKIKELASVLEELIEKFGEAEDAQVKFAIKYDHNKKVQKVFDMLAELFEFDSKFLFLEQNMSVHLKSITSRNLTSNTIRRLNEELMSDKSLRSEVIVVENKICGILMEFIEVLLKSYGFARRLAVIESEIESEKNKQLQATQSNKGSKANQTGAQSGFGF